MPWQFEYDGQTYNESAITLDQMERIEDLTGSTWRNISILGSARYARTVMAVLVADRTGKPFAEVVKLIGTRTLPDVIDSIKPVEEDTPTQYLNGNPTPAGEP